MHNDAAIRNALASRKSGWKRIITTMVATRMISVIAAGKIGLSPRKLAACPHETSQGPGCGGALLWIMVYQRMGQSMPKITSEAIKVTTGIISVRRKYRWR